MDTHSSGKERLLLIDTCGDVSWVALSLGQDILATEDLMRGSASAEIVSAVRRLLGRVGWRLADLDAVGVVCGPGSFTGMRTGLAAAKGFCEASDLRLAAVSRLEVLLDAASLQDGFAVLDAGRGELYVREKSTGREWLCWSSDLIAIVKGKQTPTGSDKKSDSLIAIAEERLAERFAGCEIVLHPLHVRNALHVVLRQLHEGGSDVSLTDANYVRGESDIYRKSAGAEKPTSAGA